jgi:hypothetical protein
MEQASKQASKQVNKYMMLESINNSFIIFMPGWKYIPSLLQISQPLCPSGKFLQPYF